ncbi:MAG TPA: hypothetical protein V6C97_03540, partial [Oculatellaceae cyanobacterium]
QLESIAAIHYKRVWYSRNRTGHNRWEVAEHGAGPTVRMLFDWKGRHYLHIAQLANEDNPPNAEAYKPYAPLPENGTPEDVQNHRAVQYMLKKEMGIPYNLKTLDVINETNQGYTELQYKEKTITKIGKKGKVSEELTYVEEYVTLTQDDIETIINAPIAALTANNHATNNTNPPYIGHTQPSKHANTFNIAHTHKSIKQQSLTGASNTQLPAVASPTGPGGNKPSLVHSQPSGNTNKANADHTQKPPKQQTGLFGADSNKHPLPSLHKKAKSPTATQKTHS